MSNRKSMELSKLLFRLKFEAGPKYNETDLAKKCSVKTACIKQWFYGRRCGEDKIGNIARYFSKITDIHFFDLYTMIENARLQQETKNNE